ncbi:formyltetrahydrofolate deformylase [Glutamicibacter halophytocola]|uniref:Formyltetrahydrofolate deformylase n=1 Tax=Glutamicibacter halophytocola TaxID=1933880 RepID=A0ABX5YCX0_9MICC|nr:MULTISPECIES: formyltetrahydrofolate deformylase [Glutamicibacter]MBF6672572.1 formyltetrahydrofolate deformylase [Glutamicibacter sp. FBE19]NQD40215.1 formyltetrahydrofolate deformylase [Glutamicibacter halophytocola]QDY67494.1 formyltetrahydrofolate deformylase [Glutamicibacter halophytocola]
MNNFIVTLSCIDRPGIVHAISGGLLGAGCNITESQQFLSPETGTFFMRIEVTTEQSLVQIRAGLAPIRDDFHMSLRVADGAKRTRTMLMCSKAGHALNDLLFAQRSGTLPIDVPVIVSNHLDLKPMADFYGVEFVHLPVTKENKSQSEAELLKLAEDYNIELVVLARYMQILSDSLCERMEGRVINIHHSFLPSFKGAKPYHQAYARGVKLIGATAHYVTADLDEGPIIDQEVTHVSHTRTAEQLVELGRSVEGRTLTRAVQWHAEHRVMLDGQRTIVFS